MTALPVAFRLIYQKADSGAGDLFSSGSSPLLEHKLSFYRSDDDVLLDVPGE
jgi:hypothetical protein